jgi:hypothetical protein
MRKDITPEHEPRPARALLAPPDFEGRAMDLAILALSDVLECDGAGVNVKWDEVMGKTCPILYVYFADHVCDPSVPRMHLDPAGKLRPAHAICLASLPSGHILSDARITDAVRKGVEDFLRKFHVRKSGPALTVGGRVGSLSSGLETRTGHRGRYVASVLTSSPKGS